MEGILRKDRWLPAIAAGLIAALLLAASGCGSSSSGGSAASTPASTTTGPQSKGKVYVAVTGSKELQAGDGNMGMAVVNLDNKQVEMVDLPETKAPHGILFGVDTMTAPNTSGRVATATASLIYLGNAQDGSINVIDAATNKVTRTVNAPAGAKLAICGMEKGPDGLIYLASMGDGKVYLFDTDKGEITDTRVGGGGTTTSICGIVWSRDGQYAYLGNMYNPGDPTSSGYIAKVKIDAGMDKVINRFPAGKEPNSIVFSADGKTAYISVRHEPIPDLSSIFVYDVASDKVIDRIAGIPAPLVCRLILSQ